MNSKNKVKIVEVGPRDGLQNESRIIPTKLKENFIRNLCDAGLKNLEVTSFVSPKAIAQMKDSLELYERVSDLDCCLSVFVANEKGAENALKFGLQEVSVFTTSSERFAQKNVNATIAGTLQRLQVIKEMLGEKVKLRGYISTVFGCPYEGKTSEKKVLELIEKLFQAGCYEVSLGDTIGIAHPSQVKSVLKKIEKHFGLSKIAVHFHDTRGLGIANAVASLEQGIRIFDSSAGGLGGCPYAKGASGNIATEDLNWLLESEGFETGIDSKKLYEASKEIFEFLGKISHAKMNTYLSKQS